jgi:glycosyltransferase involved in cell wall biosynthesis
MLPRVALLTNYEPDESLIATGVESVTEALLEGLASHQDEFEFHVVALRRQLREVAVEKSRGFIFHFIPIPHSAFKRPRTLFSIPQAEKELRRVHAAVVHCQDNMALSLAAIRAGQSDLFTVHGVKREEARKWSGQEYWSHQLDGLIERYVHKKFKAFIAVSQYSASFFGKSQRVFLIPNPVSRRWFVASSPAKTVARRLICIGSYNRLKRQDWLLKAVAVLYPEVTQYEVVVCGSIDDKRFFNELQGMARDKRLSNVLLRGPVSRNELHGLLSSGTILVHPSAQENSPMVVAEAMAMGLPVVAPRIGGVPEMIQHGVHGLLFDSDRFDDLVVNIRRIVLEAELREKLSREARKRACELFDPSNIASQTVDVYRTLLREKI